MEKMRVSTMKVVKYGQEKLPDHPAEAPRRDRTSLRARMREAAQKQAMRQREAEEARPAALRGKEGRSMPLSRSGRTRQTGGRAAKEQGRPWRYDFLVQAGVCAFILLSIVGFRAIDTPLTNQITDGITQVVTMDVDVGKDIGRLQFVRNIVPESVLTFWESTNEDPAEFRQPFVGEITLSFGDDRPGIVYTGEDQAVFAAAAGTVESVVKEEDNYVLRLSHGGGYETVYRLLQGVKVAPGDAVEAGQEIALALPGDAGNHLYFQMLRAGKALDPLELLPL